MDNKQLPPCWELQSNFVEQNVRQLLQVIADVLEDINNHKHELDSNWSTGVRAYDWVRNVLIQKEDSICGLNMLSTSLDYVMCLNNVPLQFAKDYIHNPKKRHRLLRNRVEVEQLSLFEKCESEQDITWRILAQPVYSEDDDAELEQSLPSWDVALVGFNAYGVLISMVTNQSTANLPTVSVDSSSLPEETKINDPHLRLRKKENKMDTKSNGTSSD